jgi:hypothetical protein
LKSLKLPMRDHSSNFIFLVDLVKNSSDLMTTTGPSGLVLMLKRYLRITLLVEPA